MAIRTKRLLPPPFTSTSTSSRPSDCATRCATSSILDATGSRIVAKFRRPTKKWAFAHSIGPTLQITVYRVWAGRGRADCGGGYGGGRSPLDAETRRKLRENET